MSRWFLPETPDVLGLLGQQIEVTIAGMDAFARLAAGEAAAQAEVRTYEHRADERKPELHRTLRTAFITPLEPEDLFALSRGSTGSSTRRRTPCASRRSWIALRTSRLRRWPFSWRPAVRELDTAVATLAPGVPGTTASADRAVKAARRIERVYRTAMGELLRVDDLREVMARRELYRRGSRIGEHVVDVAERVLYAAVKET